MLRAWGIPILVGLSLIGVIWFLAWLFQFQLPADLDPMAGPIRKRGIPCYKDREIVFVNKKVCIYVCSTGEKTRVEGIDKCLKEIEIEP